MRAGVKDGIHLLLLFKWKGGFVLSFDGEPCEEGSGEFRAFRHDNSVIAIRQH